MPGGEELEEIEIIVFFLTFYPFIFKKKFTVLFMFSINKN